MGKTNFTKQFITGLVPPATGRETYYDSKVRGLGILVQHTGYKAFFWFKKIRSYPHWKSLGRFPELTVEAARAEAEKNNVKLANWKARDYEGDNPFAKQRAPTVAALVDLYIEHQIKAYSTNPDRVSKDIKNDVKNYWARWKPLKLSFVTRREIIAWHADLGKKHGHVTANRQWERLRTVFRWASKRGIWNGSNPAQIQKGDKFPERTRERFIQREEVPQFFTALQAETNLNLRDFIVIALFTGARRGDILAMRWDQVSGNLWTVPNAKKPDRPYVVQLVDEVLVRLRERKKRVGGASWVFPSKKAKCGHVTTLKRGWSEFLKRSSLSNLKIHDLRRTLASWQAQQGTSLLIIGKSLGHRDPRSTAVYARLQTEAPGKSVERATRAMLAAKAEQS